MKTFLLSILGLQAWEKSSKLINLPFQAIFEYVCKPLPANLNKNPLKFWSRMDDHKGKKVLMIIIIKGDSECGGLSLKAGALNGTTFCIRCLLRKVFLSFSFHF